MTRVTVPGSFSCFKWSKRTEARTDCRAITIKRGHESVNKKNEDNSGASQYCCGEQFEPAKPAPTEKLKKEDPLVEAIHLTRSSIENDLTKKLI